IEHYYSLDNAIITVAGSIERTEIVNMLNEFFSTSSVKTPRTDTITNPWEKWDQNWEGNHVYKTKPMDRPLTYVNMAWAMPGTSSGKGLVMEMVNTMIGNSKTSLVYKEIIGKGIVPSLKYMAEFFVPVSAGSLKFVSPPEKAPEIYSLVLNRVLKKARSMDITTDLIRRLQDELIGDYILQIEDPSSLGMDVMNRYIKYGEVISPEEYVKRVREITPEDFKDTIRMILDEARLTVYTMGSIPDKWEPELTL
ncbi:MAG: M16 family metallopeptidase, partial [Candidatus Hodarchaeales archaeon]